MTPSPLAHWAMWEKWGSELYFLWTETPRALLWGQLSYGWTCTSLWVQWKLRDVCSQLKASGLSSGPGSDFSPREARSVGRGAVRGGMDHAISCRFYCSLLFPTLLAEWHLYQLLPKGVTLVKCHRLQHEWSFSILHFSPCRLPSTPQVPFFILRGHRLEIQVQEKVITFFLQVCLSKKPPNHLWLKHRDYSRGKMLLVAALPASLSGFHSPLFSHAKANDDSMVDCCCLPAFLATLGGLRLCPSGGQSSHSMSPK